jgi:hypothetical protein
MEPNDQQANQSPNSPQVIKPGEMFNPTVPPQTPGPSAQPSQPSPQPQSPLPDYGQRKKILIIIGGVVALFILIMIIVLIVSSGSGKNGQDEENLNNQSAGIIKEPTAIDIENANNSISSDITGLNDDEDFPTSNLSDENLEL